MAQLQGQTDSLEGIAREALWIGQECWEELWTRRVRNVVGKQRSPASQKSARIVAMRTSRHQTSTPAVVRD
jgi:hypothetical protein